MKIAYLACAECLPNAVNRRPDAYEHDREVAVLRPPIVARGGQLIEIDWRTCDPAAFDLLFVRTTWDYVEHQSEFLAFLRQAETLTRVVNDPALIAWNLSKLYLAELAARGLPVIPSVFTGEPLPLSQIFETLQTDEMVLKPVVGAGGFGQSRVSRERARADDMMLPALFAQPLMPQISTWGEASMIFIDGQFCHAVRKVPGAGQYLTHVIHGGAEVAYLPGPAEIATAQTFVDALPRPALAARVDMVPHEGQMWLMELEVIEPHLFPLFGPELGERVAQACFNRSLTPPP